MHPIYNHQRVQNNKHSFNLEGRINHEEFIKSPILI
jgi:hypothetical protein